MAVVIKLYAPIRGHEVSSRVGVLSREKNMKYYISFAFIICLLFVSSSIAFGQLVAGNTDDRYRIGFQDTLDIQVFRHPELNKKVTVNPNGTIYLFRLDKPLIAVCKTEIELSSDIEAAYKVSYLKDPQVGVIVSEQKSQSVSIIGAVEKAGTYFVSKRMHLLELLALAGGPNKESGTRLIVARTGSSSNCKTATDTSTSGDDVSLSSYKVRDIQEGKKTVWIQPGDIVSVLDADLVYVYGNVVKPGQLKVREPITLTQAIASSEGLKSASEKDSVRILRQKPDSIERIEIPFNLNDIEKGKTNDPYLEPNDIVAVSKDGTKAFMNGFMKALTNGLPTLLSRGVGL